ncbi:TetR/AcrR family transcriptional regulator [Arthrobacter sp. MDT3-44]
MARPRKQLLSRDIILEAALELVGRHRDFTITGIAQHLGVNPSSLYHHMIGGRDEIIEALRERIYREIDLGALGGADASWQSRIEYWVLAYREAVARYPSAIPLLLGRMVDDAPTLALYEVLASALVEAGVPREQHLAVISMLDALVFGSALDAASPDPLWLSTADTHPALHGAGASEAAPDRIGEGLRLGIRAAISYLEVSRAGLDRV